MRTLRPHKMPDAIRRTSRTECFGSGGTVSRTCIRAASASAAESVRRTRHPNNAHSGWVLFTSPALGTRLDTTNIRAARVRAFSLAELLIAIGIMAIGITFVASSFPVGLSMTRDTAEQTTAMLVADEAVETIKTRCRPWAVVRSLTSDSTPSVTEEDLYPNRTPEFYMYEYTRSELFSGKSETALLFTDPYDPDNPMSAADRQFPLTDLDRQYSGNSQYFWEAFYYSLNGETPTNLDSPLAAGTRFMFIIFIFRSPTTSTTIGFERTRPYDPYNDEFDEHLITMDSSLDIDDFLLNYDIINQPIVRMPAFGDGPPSIWYVDEISGDVDGNEGRMTLRQGMVIDLIDLSTQQISCYVPRIVPDSGLRVVGVYETIISF